MKHLIESNDQYYNDLISKIISNVNSSGENVFKDISDEFRYKEFVKSLSESDKQNYATFVLNSDGSPVFKSSSLCIGPIQLILNEIPMKERIRNNITCGIWFGSKKPDMNIFLKSFVNHMNQLGRTGIQCTILGCIRAIKLFCIGCCVDSVTRCQMQGIHQYNGYFGCSWCLHPGKYSESGKSMKYPLLKKDPDPRDDAQARDNMDILIKDNISVNGFVSAPELRNLKCFNIVHGFFCRLYAQHFVRCCTTVCKILV